jgi:LacI family transcriptional regulator, galactose operon repressor
MSSFGQPTINDVARRANVSNMTVSRVVTRNGYVSDKTRRKVEAAIAELGYQPNAAAKSMRTKSTQSIGFILPDLANSAHAIVAQTAEALLARQGYRMVLGSTGFSPEREGQFFSSSQQNTVDGVIAVITDETQTSLHALIQKSRVPIVILDRDLPFPIDTVYSEDRASMRDVVRYLAKLGHERIGLMTSPVKARPGRLRRQAFEEALAEMGLACDPALVRLRHQISANGYQAALELLKAPRPPTALVVAADQLTFGALRAIKEMGLSIPHDISLVGSDEGFISSVVDPPLTIISRDMQAVGTHAANMLLARLADPAQAPQSVTVRSEVILRQSCDRPRDGA